MKQKMSHIFIVLMAVYIGFAAMGVNVFHYCCEACHDHGSSYFHYVSCSDVHEEYSCSDCLATSEEKCCKKRSCYSDSNKCGAVHEPVDDCGVDRLHVDCFTVEEESEKTPLVIELLDMIHPMVHIVSLHIFASFHEVSTFIEQTVPLSNRDILCQSSILII